MPTAVQWCKYTSVKNGKIVPWNHNLKDLILLKCKNNISYLVLRVEMSAMICLTENSITFTPS